MKQHLLVLTIFLTFTVSTVFASDPPLIQPWERVVCIQSPEKDKAESMKLCSAFLVQKADQLFLIASGHGSDETSARSKVVYRDPSGKSQQVSMNLLFSGISNPWQRDATSDFAIALIQPDEKGESYVKHLTGLSVPLDSICTETQLPTKQIVTAGFPLGLGVRDPISPLVIVGHIASVEIETDTKWGREPIIYCTPAVAQGTSGGPAFLMDESPDTVTVVGIYVGVVGDATGGKLSKMVPSRLIHAAIANYKSNADNE